MRIHVLPKKEWNGLYGEAFVKPANIATLDLEHEWEELGTKLRAALGERWSEGYDADFDVSDDWSESFHHCGAIYTHSLLCPLYPQLIVQVIATMKHKERWTFHTTIEPSGANSPTGQFFIRSGAIFAPTTPAFDYAKVFGKE